MKKQVSLGLLILLFATPLFADKLIFKVKPDTLNIRAKPTVKSEIIGQLTRGDYIFTDSSKIEGKWVQIKTDEGKTGYVYIDYLQDVTPHGAGETIKFYLNYFVEKYLLTTFFILILLGIILGLTKSVVVYRDYSDVVLCASLLVIPLGAILLFGRLMLIFQSDTVNQIFLWSLIIFEVLLFLYIIARTYNDNGRSIIKTFVAVITKIPLTILFTLLLLELVTPEEKGKKSDKTDILLILAIITPLIYGLVRHKVWVYKGDEEVEKKISEKEIEKILKPKV